MQSSSLHNSAAAGAGWTKRFHEDSEPVPSPLMLAVMSSARVSQAEPPPVGHAVRKPASPNPAAERTFTEPRLLTGAGRSNARPVADPTRKEPKIPMVPQDNIHQLRLKAYLLQEDKIALTKQNRQQFEIVQRLQAENDKLVQQNAVQEFCISQYRRIIFGMPWQRDANFKSPDHELNDLNSIHGTQTDDLQLDVFDFNAASCADSDSLSIASGSRAAGQVDDALSDVVSRRSD